MKREFIPSVWAALEPAISHSASVQPFSYALRSVGRISVSLVKVNMSMSYCNRSQRIREQFVIDEKPAITNLPE